MIEFKNFNGFVADEIVTELHQGDRCFDLHNEWDFLNCSWSLEKDQVELQWRNTANPHERCTLKFEGTTSLTIEAPEEGKPVSDRKILSNLVYQALPSMSAFVRLWFEDGTIISIASQLLTLQQ